MGGMTCMSNEILIVDDEDRIRRLLKMYLERESFEIHEASNGQEAYELAMENNRLLNETKHIKLSRI